MTDILHDSMRFVSAQKQQCKKLHFAARFANGTNFYRVETCLRISKWQKCECVFFLFISVENVRPTQAQHGATQ